MSNPNGCMEIRKRVHYDRVRAKFEKVEMPEYLTKKAIKETIHFHATNISNELMTKKRRREYD
tara:strand:- start:501 stop:689 length:189 start_codon:yes stop_codon:yes gene_type:complete